MNETWYLQVHVANMSCRLIVLLAALPSLVTLFAVAADLVTIEENVAVLNNENFEEFISQEDYTIVEFYAPCVGGRTKRLCDKMPHETPL